MNHSLQADFGKRNTRNKTRSVKVTDEKKVPLFPGPRDEPAAIRTDRVADSFLAAVKAGGVVGAFFMVLDVTGNGNTFRSLSAVLPGHREALMLIPFLLLLGLMSGGMAAATSLLLAHPVLKRVGWTAPIAYAIGGAAAASAVSYAMYMLLRSAPMHGFMLDCLAGGLGGYYYRFFARGSASASDG